MSLFTYHVPPIPPGSNHDKAVKELARRKAERTLACPSCRKENAPGRMNIDIDDHDRAWCPCGHAWRVPVHAS